jgi:CRISPR-associated protein Cas2
VPPFSFSPKKLLRTARQNDLLPAVFLLLHPYFRDAHNLPCLLRHLPRETAFCHSEPVEKSFAALPHMRSTYLVCYDICNDKRLRKVFRTCRNYGDHLQYSVFECDLNESERVKLETELKAIINAAEDQVLFVSLGPAESRGARDIRAIGLPYTKLDLPCYVV